MPDIYDAEIAYLKANPHEIKRHWLHSSPLFEYLIPRGTSHTVTGCPVFFRSEPYSRFRHIAGFPEFEQQVRNDERIPADEDTLCVDHLAAFADIQRQFNQLARWDANERHQRWLDQHPGIFDPVSV